jgi:hypothetical protein
VLGLIEMQEHFREFEVSSDPFGRTCHVQFRWLQTGISIRHADTVDVKFIVKCDDEPEEEKVIALPHAALVEISRQRNRILTDPWCMKIAALHLRHMIETAADIEKTIVTLSHSEISDYDRELYSAPVAAG